MTITLQLSLEQEQRLEEGAARHDEKTVREVLLQAVEAAVPKLLGSPALRHEPKPVAELLDAMASDFPDAPALPDEALTRAGIYREHP